MCSQKLRRKEEKGMKKFWQTMEKDYQKEEFTRKEMVVYGILVPVGFVAIMLIAGWMESLG